MDADGRHEKHLAEFSLDSTTVPHRGKADVAPTAEESTTMSHMASKSGYTQRTSSCLSLDRGGWETRVCGVSFKPLEGGRTVDINETQEACGQPSRKAHVMGWHFITIYKVQATPQSCPLLCPTDSSLPL